MKENKMKRDPFYYWYFAFIVCYIFLGYFTIIEPNKKQENVHIDASEKPCKCITPTSSEWIG